MKSVAIIAFTRRGCTLARQLAHDLAGQGDYAGAAFSVSGPARFAGELGIDAYESLGAWTEARFAADDALVFVGATGIAVRAIAPYVRDKFADPAVVSVDEAGLFAVPLLSGHVGGANGLARAIADALGGQAVVSTATDVNGLFAVDEWAARLGLAIVERDIAKEVSAALLEGRPVGYRRDFDPLNDAKPFDGLVDGPADIGFVVSLDDTAQPFARTLHLVPRVVAVGVGCRKGTDPAILAHAVDAALAKARISAHAVRVLSSIDVKEGEPAIRQLAESRGWGLKFYSAEELAAVPGRFSSSDFVKSQVGVDNVCERAACAEGATLVVGKQSGDGVTVAIATLQVPPEGNFERGRANG